MDHLAYRGSDADWRYLMRIYNDGSVTLSMRPIGGERWTPEIDLELDTEYGAALMKRLGVPA